MAVLKVVFCRRAHPGSWLLRMGMRSSWSHCGIVTPDATVLEAAAFHGVRETPLAQFMPAWAAWQLRDVEVPDVAAAVAFARTQLGKPYDWPGAFGVAFGERRWQDPDSWFCSELVEAAAAAGGRQRFVNDAWRVTPQHSWMVA
jgi:uncharacterized protein YycO